MLCFCQSRIHTDRCSISSSLPLHIITGNLYLPMIYYWYINIRITKEGQLKVKNVYNVSPTCYGIILTRYIWMDWIKCSLCRQCQHYFRVMVFNATFNNISVISWRSFLLVEETGENHCAVANHLQTLSHNVVHITIWTYNVSGGRHCLHR